MNQPINKAQEIKDPIALAHYVYNKYLKGPIENPRQFVSSSSFPKAADFYSSLNERLGFGVKGYFSDAENEEDLIAKVEGTAKRFDEQGMIRAIARGIYQKDLAQEWNQISPSFKAPPEWGQTAPAPGLRGQAGEQQQQQQQEQQPPTAGEAPADAEPDSALGEEYSMSQFEEDMRFYEESNEFLEELGEDISDIAGIDMSILRDIADEEDEKDGETMQKGYSVKDFVKGFCNDFGSNRFERMFGNSLSDKSSRGIIK